MATLDSKYGLNKRNSKSRQFLWLLCKACIKKVIYKKGSLNKFQDDIHILN